MLSFSSAQLAAWIAAYAYPVVRILAFIAVAPPWNSNGVPRRTRLILGLAIAIAIAPVLPKMPAIDPGSLAGFAILALQILIGLAMGFAARIVFSAVETAGEFIGFQMGLSFATFYDPLSASQTPVVTEFLTLISFLLFLSLDGHLLYVATLAESFNAIPVGPLAPAAGSWLNIVELGGTLFSAGLLLALPIIVALGITNLALGVLTRAAPQLNLFALGFPLTLLGGFAALAIAMNYLAEPLQKIYDLALRAMLDFAVK